MEIKIIAESLSSIELLKLLEYKNNELTFELRPKTITLREIDPTVLVAIIGASGTALVTLINRVFSIIKERELAKVVVESKEGTKIEIPSNYSSEKVDELFEKIKNMESPRILISKH